MGRKTRKNVSSRVFELAFNRLLEVLPRNDRLASQVGLQKYVLFDEITRSVNHSCEPNCGIRGNDQETHEYVALRLIEPDDELTFDYAMRNLDIEFFRGWCLCGMPSCRGLIEGYARLSPQLKKAYSGFVAPYLEELDV